ncbi:hypothetical protein EVAR_50395_1 [Eumeta japonica]|uniref:Uncharacterized protein n=1 Tax=Eumeta variegata TaxID=151549 RepID=A0A4C1WUF4_EUMVA|nr:hypothetical protein EVAR_50395_1 [Eumeta japonica]
MDCLSQSCLNDDHAQDDPFRDAMGVSFNLYWLPAELLYYDMQIYDDLNLCNEQWATGVHTGDDDRALSNVDRTSTHRPTDPYSKDLTLINQ